MIPVSATQIARSMGGERTVQKRIRTFSQLRQAVEEGLPLETAVEVSAHLPTDLRDEFLGMTHLGPRLAPSTSERVERTARILALAKQVWGSDLAGATLFLATKHKALGSVEPLRVAQSEIGARQVEELLLKIGCGFPC